MSDPWRDEGAQNPNSSETEALHRTAERLGLALEMSGSGVWRWNILTGAMIWDEAMHRQFGLAPGTFGGTVEAFLALIHPDDRVGAARTLSQVAQAQTALDVEYRAVWPDGAVHHLAARGRTVDRDGPPEWMTGVTQDVTARRQAEEARAQLLRQMVDAQEEERRRISRDLHDETGQSLTALSLGLRALRDEAAPQSAARTAIERMEQLVEDMGRGIHHLAVRLRPTALDDLGLSEALLNYLDEWSEHSGLTVDFHSDGMDSVRLPSHIETIIYRVVQEALTNVLKHAQATRVSLILEHRDQFVQAIIEDNGRGFEADAPPSSSQQDRRLGMVGMKERAATVAGTVTIESSPNGGTTVFLRLPLEQRGNEP